MVLTGWGLLALVPGLVLPTTAPRAWVERQFFSHALLVSTEMPVTPSMAWPLRLLAYGSIVAASVVAGCVALALMLRGSRESGVRRLSWFLAPLPLALGIEYFLMPQLSSMSGLMLAGSLAAAAFGVSVSSLVAFPYVFPRRIEDRVLRESLAALPHLKGKEGEQRFMGAWFRREERALDIGIWQTALVTAFVLLSLLPGPLFPTFLVVGIGYSLLSSWQTLNFQRLQPEGGRVTWLLGGILMAVVSWALVGSLPFALGPLMGDVGWQIYLPCLLALGPFVALLILVGACALSVFYRGDLDARVVIRRTALAAGIATLLLFGFGAMENVLTDLLFGALGLPDGAGAIVAGGTMAVVFKPVHDFVDRRLPSWTAVPAIPE